MTGQDGSLLANYLLAKGEKVTGTYRRSSSNNFWRLEELGILKDLLLVEYSIGTANSDLKRIFENGYDQIYHLAGDSFTVDSFKHPLLTINTNLIGSLDMLDNVKEYSPHSKLFLASSSEIFGLNNQKSIRVNELTQRNPSNPYGISQSNIIDLSRIYRENYDLDISVGILFNHESPFRSPQFLTQKIVTGLRKIREGTLGYLELGNLESKKDWGSAKEFVEIFNSILENTSNNEYIIATGKLTSVKEIFIYCARYFGVEPYFKMTDIGEECYDAKSNKLVMRTSNKFFRKYEKQSLIGDSTKLISDIGRKPSRPIYEVLFEMCERQKI